MILKCKNCNNLYEKPGVKLLEPACIICGNRLEEVLK